MVLMVFFSSRISPRTATVILRDRSPLATAVVTCAMLRTCAVRLPAMEFTESVRSFHVPATPRTSACPPRMPSVPTSRATRVTSEAKRVELVDHGVDGVLEFQNFAAHVHGDFAGKVAVGHGGSHFGDVADLSGQVAGHGVHRIGEVFPHAAHALHLRLAAEFAFGADFARHARHFRSEGAQLIHHGVDGVLELQDFARTSTVILRERSPLATAVVTSAMLRTWR
jgi:hypothetical protein